MNSSIAVDSNIILYAFDKDETNYKNQIALQLIQDSPCFSSQVLSEVVNVFNRRWKRSKEEIIGVSNFLINNCTLIPVTKEDVILSHHLIKSYDFQYFDAMIVAAALNTKCKVLYSEDMQHQMVINNQLTIINPFI